MRERKRERKRDRERDRQAGRQAGKADRQSVFSCLPRMHECTCSLLYASIKKKNPDPKVMLVSSDTMGHLRSSPQETTLNR